MAGGSQERARAARVLVRIIEEGKTTDQSFGQDDAIPPLVNELVYGTLRHYFDLVPLVDRYLTKDFRSKDLDLRALLLVGAYQLHYMRVPDHASINETVSAARALKKPWARGLINAVLRKVAADRPDSEELAEPKTGSATSTERSFGLPEWIYERLAATYPEAASELAKASLERAPMSLRVNVQRTDPNTCQQTLAETGASAGAGWIPEQLILDESVAVRELPGHALGHFSVQDGGALFAAPLLLKEPFLNKTREEPSRPLRILDACAAPGGKLFHIAERAPSADLTALEVSKDRLSHLRAEAERLGHKQIRLLQGDATKTDWFDSTQGELFDAILLDAPCSGTGTLRRHPDIKVLRRPEDLPGYVALQRQLLKNLWQLLAPGGTFLYCTCSLFTEENDQVMEDFLATHSDAELDPLSLPVGQRTDFGWQLLPLPSSTEPPNRTVDGFYYARMTRQETRQEKAS